LFGAAVVVVAAQGALALLVSLGALGGATSPAEGQAVPTSPATAAAYAAAIALSLALTALVAWSPRRFAHLMPVLVTGAGAAALALLVHRAWLGFATALACAVVSALAWAALWLSARPSVATRARDAALLDAMLAAIAPAGGPFALGAADAPMRDGITRTFAALHGRRDTWLRLALRVLDLRSIVEHRCGFTGLHDDARATLVARLARSRVPALRGLGGVLRTVVLTRVYEDERTQELIGYDGAWVQQRIDAGPNADAHRARREALARAAEEEWLVAAVDGEAAGGVPGDDAREAPTRAEAEPPASAGSGERLHPEEVPFDRPWTLGVPREGVTPALGTPLLRAARALGPTRP
jgi:hypothetical protein